MGGGGDGCGVVVVVVGVGGGSGGRELMGAVLDAGAGVLGATTRRLPQPAVTSERG